MPELLALRDADGAVRAAVGCRAAATEPLFLETYTREPIEAALARRTGFFVPRERSTPLEAAGLLYRDNLRLTATREGRAVLDGLLARLLA